ncbi:VIT1/CCC1 transporter family protein [Candidatus Woesearchaeota archaeon]|nr:VIT1/CCC1 transporter family protein [Candidatus Woesearchaeota archaeon]
MKNRLGAYFKILVEHEIVRRYVIINLFDGALTIMGIIIAVFLSGFRDPKLIILPSIGATIAMAVSGIWGAYAAERAEIKNKIRELEAHLMKGLTGTEFSRKRENMAWVISIVDGVIPLLASLIIILPFFLVNPGIITMDVAFYISMAAVIAILFGLGAFAGWIAKENSLKQGFIMLLAGVVIGVIFMLLAFLGVI